MRLLLIASPALENALLTLLEKEGLAIDVVDSLERAEFKLKSRTYEAVLFDQQPERITTSLARWRHEGISAHIIVLLPRASNPLDRASCLDSGADVCMTHPIHTEE